MKIKSSRAGVSLRLDDDERQLVSGVAEQVLALLGGRRSGDVALQRLLPDAYRGDDEAANEFRRLTEDDLVTAKLADATVVRDTAAARELTVAQAEAWLRTFTDARLVLGERLGIEADGQAERMWEESRDPDVRGLLAVSAHLGFVQELIIVALEEGGH